MEQNHHPTPESIMKIGTGFWASKVLLAAVHFDLFTKLAEKKSMSVAEIQSALNLKSTNRNVCDFLDTLVSFGFLKRDGILASSRYSNGADADFFLDKNKPSYLGGLLNMLNNRLYGFWANLEEGLRTGLPQNEAKDGRNLFTELYGDPVQLKGFIDAMSGIQIWNFMTFAQSFDFSKYKTLADVGGSSGLLSLMVAKHQPHMQCVTFDLPPVAPIAQGTINHFQLSERVKVASGDFLQGPIPTADVVVMGNILHDWDEDNKVMLMKKAYEALPSGGAFVAIEGIIDNERRKNSFGLLMSLNMLIETGKGFDYTFDDFNKWSGAAGFRSTSLLPLAGPSSAAIAFK